MRREVKCMFCGNTWSAKNPQNFLVVCGVCFKLFKEYFNEQMKKRRLRLEAK